MEPNKYGTYIRYLKIHKMMESKHINHHQSSTSDFSQGSVQPSVLCVTRVAVMVLMLECNPVTPGSSAVPVDRGSNAQLCQKGMREVATDEHERGQMNHLMNRGERVTNEHMSDDF